MIILGSGGGFMYALVTPKQLKKAKHAGWRVAKKKKKTKSVKP